MAAARMFRLALAGVTLLAVGSARAASAKQIEALYAPFRVERAALAPDGKHVAFAVRGARGVELHIFETGQPNKKIVAGPPHEGELRLLSWISPEQLMVVAGAFTVTLTDPSGTLVRSVDTTNLFRRVPGADDFLSRPGARVVQSSDDPAVLIFESNFKFEDEPGFPPPERANILEVHHLDVRTGESKRLMEYDVESPAVGVTILDRLGQPRLVRRTASSQARFVYRTSDVPPSGLAIIGTLFTGDVGWSDLYRIFPDQGTFAFSGDAETAGRAIPVAFDVDPNLLYFASNVRHDAFGLYAADVRTGKRTEFAIEAAGLDLVEPESPWLEPPLVFDRARRTLVGVRERGAEPRTRWLDAELAAAQGELEKKFPSRRVQILDWDDARERFLALIGGLGDPGRYFIFQRASGRCMEFLRVAPALPARETNPAESFVFTTAAGVRLTGYLTLPRRPGKAEPPLVVMLHGGPERQLAPGFDPDAQAFATMGFAVVRINYRGSSGFGTAHREAAREHLDTAPVDDVMATLEWLRRAHRRVDLRRVGVIGEGYGGYLALRALQLHPEAIQSVVAVNGLVTPLDWWAGLEPPIRAPTGSSEVPPADFSSDPRRTRALRFVSHQSGLRSISVAANPELLTKPVFLLHDPDSKETPSEPMERLRATLRRQKRSPEWEEISAGFAQGDRRERAQVHRRIGEFLNLTLYDFAVKIGDVKEKKDEPKK